MRKIVFIISMLLFFASMGAQGDELIGTWRLDRTEGAKANQAPPSLSYRFNPDGSCVMSAIDKNGSLQETTWTYEVSDDHVRMKLVGSKKLAEVFRFSVDGDVLTMRHRDSSFPTLVLRRSQ
jgi:hypothetical protein